MPRFSVIIPLYNKQGYIEKAVSSVLEQDFTDFELIVVEDCSTDQSLEVAQKMTDSRIRIIRHPFNKGLSASRNTGIRHAKSNFLAFLDADDQWKSKFLSSMNVLIDHYYPEALLFASKYEVLLANHKTVEYPFKPLAFKTHGILEDFFNNSIGYTHYCPSSLCVAKEVFSEIGLYDESITFSEDVDFNIRAHLKFKMAFYNVPLVTYLVSSENQITHGSLAGKVIPNYDAFEVANPGHGPLKKYLDFQRYVKAKLFKLQGNSNRATALIRNIDFDHLNWKQSFCLKCHPLC